MDHQEDHEPKVTVTDKRQAHKAASASPEELAAAEAARDEARVMAKRAWVGAHEGEGGEPLSLEAVDRLQAMTEEELDARILEIQATNAENNQIIDHQGVTAFIVLIGHDGSAVGIADVDAQISIDRPANPWDMYNGCAQVMRDLTAMESANRVLMGMQQMGAMAAQSRQVRQAQQRLQTPGGRG